MSIEHTTETGIAMTTKAAPPIVVTAANLSGVTVPELVQWATLIYLVIMISHKLYSIIKEWRNDRKLSKRRRRRGTDHEAH